MRDARGRSPSPKQIGDVLQEFRAEVAPATPMASVQAVWDEVVGTRIAEVTNLIEEREGVLRVECSSAVWAQELELMSPRILRRLRERLGDEAPNELRFRAGS
jgi:predicted nucleic acid-binding Zn ribbon protein